VEGDRHQKPGPLDESFGPLGRTAAMAESNRCLFCYDAPCTHACPTHIDIPGFIKKISTGNVLGSARTILESNLLGATCARVCPVQELCEGACVLGASHQPIAIGRLQRHAMDYIFERSAQIPTLIHAIAPSTGKRIAVIGAGPAGLSCAGELAKRGHAVTLFEKRDLPGGLSTYGIVSLREPMEIALTECRMIEQLGVTIRTGVELGREIDLAHLKREFAVVVLGIGLGQTPELNIPGADRVLDGLDYVERSKTKLQSFVVGRDVVVIGAGNTAIDCATIARRLGAEHVTMVYRRTSREMTAYEHEYQFARNEGIEFRFLAQPVGVLVEGGKVTGLECAQMQLGVPDTSGRPAPEPVPGMKFVLPADQIVRAIGQQKPRLAALLNLKSIDGYIAVNSEFETSTANVFAIGDCVRSRGAASTVMAVQDGKMAAAAIHARLM
jgi:dihydropyrimidine dehydrogenase (NAD+) subunit PreT